MSGEDLAAVAALSPPDPDWFKFKLLADLFRMGDGVLMRLLPGDIDMLLAPPRLLVLLL